VHITKPGKYSFCSTSDDGSFVYLDGVEIVNNDGLHGPLERSVFAQCVLCIMQATLVVLVCVCVNLFL
jgi:hypothetical protein